MVVSAVTYVLHILRFYENWLVAQPITHCKKNCKRKTNKNNVKKFTGNQRNSYNTQSSWLVANYSMTIA